MALDRQGVLVMLSDMLKNDTTMLFGQGKLLQQININATLYEDAAVTNNKPFQLFFRASPRETLVYKMQNSDIAYTIDYRICGIRRDPDEVRQKIDDIDERMLYLINNEMYTGNNFTSWYTDSTAIVFDVSIDNSSLDVEVRDTKIIAECEGGISVFINRLSS